MIFKNRTIVQIARNVKWFLNLETGITRATVPGTETVAPGKPADTAHAVPQVQTAQQGKKIEQLQGWISSKDQNLERLRHQLASKNQEINRLKAANSARQNAPIFFVVGRGRSGTNWLMQTLNAHPEVLCKGEGRFFGRDMRREYLKDMQTTGHIKAKIQPSSLYNALAESEYLRLWIERAVWTRDGDTDEQLDELTRTAIHHFLGKSLSATGKKIVGDKTPLARTEIIREIATICPEARVIHIVRDGRDVAISQMHHMWNRITDEGGIHELTSEELEKRDRYRENAQEFLGSGESIFSERLLMETAEGWNTRVGAACQDGPALLKDNYAEVRYETLLERPEEEFGRLFRFLGAQADEDTVKRCVEATSFEKRSGGRERGQEDTKSGVRKGIAGDWKNVFTERDNEVYKEIAGELLVELGYEER